VLICQRDIVLKTVGTALAGCPILRGILRRVGCKLLRAYRVSIALTKGCAFAAAKGPVGFDFDGARFAGGVVVEAAPAVVFGVGDEPSFDRVAVDVLEFFDVLFVAGDVEVVVTALPELFLVGRFESAGGQLLEDLEEGGEGVFCGFVGEEMDVLRHEDVGGYTEALLSAGLFKDL
jgi:hypothetical protein